MAVTTQQEVYQEVILWKRGRAKTWFVTGAFAHVRDLTTYFSQQAASSNYDH